MFKPKPSDFNVSLIKGASRAHSNPLEQLYTAIANDSALTSTQKSFLEYTETPIQAIFISATRANRYPNFAAYSRLIAIELLNRYLANMLNIVQTSLANTQVNHKDIALITRDIDRAKHFTDGLADKATRQLLEQEQLIQAHKSNDQKAWQKLNEQLQQNLTFGE